MEFCLASDADRAFILELEQASFPLDEAATDESLKLRLAEAPHYFYILKKSENIIGFINGTCISGPELHHDSMTTHNPNGSILVIHSVVIKSTERRKHLGIRMIHKYISIMKNRKELNEIRLLTKPKFIPLYLIAGFEFIGSSSVVHGQA